MDAPEGCGLNAGKAGRQDANRDRVLGDNRQGVSFEAGAEEKMGGLANGFERGQDGCGNGKPGCRMARGVQFHKRES